METILIFIAIFTIYFLPSIVSASRKHPSDNSIFVVNLFLGWTFLGWVISLAWALANIKTGDGNG